MENDRHCADLCEKTRLSVVLEQELDDSCKKHLQECDKCRAFLDENRRISKELSELNVPGIAPGTVSERVMKEISSSKALGFPKFRFTHHVGTAAALVIVALLFAANRGYNYLELITKENSSESVSDKAVLTDTENKDIAISGFFEPPYSSDELSDTHKSAEQVNTAADTDAGADNVPSADSPSVNAVTFSYDDNDDTDITVLTSENTAAKEIKSKEADNNTATATLSAYFNAETSDSGAENGGPVCSYPVAQSTENDGEASDSADNSESAYNSEVESESVAESTETADNSQQLKAQYTLPHNDTGSGGTVGSDVSANSEASASGGEKYDESDYNGFFEGTDTEYISIFKDLTFDDSETALKANVELANEYVRRLFDNSESINSELLVQNSISNSMFIEWAKTVEIPEHYSFESVYEFCCK